MKQQYHDKLKAHLELVHEFPYEFEEYLEKIRTPNWVENGPVSMNRFMDDLAMMYYEYFQHHIQEAWSIVNEFVSEGENSVNLENFEGNYFEEYLNKFIKEHEIDVCYVDEDGDYTYLTIAAMAGDITVAKALLENGADLISTDLFRSIFGGGRGSVYYKVYSPLSIAKAFGFDDMVQLLEKYKNQEE